MKNGKLQAKDIDDAAVFAAIDAIDARQSRSTVATWDVAEELSMPDKVVLAKLRSMHRRGIVDCQCDCGCRGDWCRPEVSPWDNLPKVQR